MIHQTIFDNFAKENAMELDRYRALVCAIETGSLSAAETLQYTPSGMSRMVAALEEETGVPLLLREHSGVRPTKECEKLLPAIRDLLHAGESCAQLSAQLRGLDVGTVTVGTAYSAFYSPLARIISDFHARYGGIQVQLRGGYSTELITQLNAHQLDLCFIPAREGGHDWLPIGYDELTAWVPAAHPMAWLPALPGRGVRQRAIHRDLSRQGHRQRAQTAASVMRPSGSPCCSPSLVFIYMCTFRATCSPARCWSL